MPLKARGSAVGVFALVFIAACGGPASEMIVTQAVPAPPSSTPTRPPVQSPTPKPPAPPTSTPTLSSSRWRVEAAITRADTSQWLGTLVLTGPARFRNFLYDPTNGNMTDLPGRFVVFPLDSLVAVSPDRSAIAYADLVTSSSAQIYIVPANSSPRGPFGRGEDRRFDVVGWINTDLVALADPSIPDGTIFALDPSDGSLSPIAPAFPSVTENGRLNRALGASAPVYYHPTMRYSLLQRYTDYQADTGTLGKLTYELLDASNSAVIWSVNAFPWSSAPTWSVDGSKFAISLFPYSKRKNTEITCGSLHVVAPPANDQLLADCSWLGISWSPDGALLAAWQGNPLGRSVREARLKVYDVARRSVEDYSIRFAEETFILQWLPPIWSPDSRYILFSEGTGELEIGRAWVLDRETASVAVLMNGVRAEAWLR